MANMSYTEPNLRDFIEKAKAHEWEVYKMTEKAEKPNKLTRENYEAKMSTKQDVLLFLYDRNEKLSKDIMKIFVHLQKRL